MADVAWAVRNTNNHGAQCYRARLDCHVQVDTWLPEAIVVPQPGQSEADSAIEHLQDGKLYLYDRGFSGFALINAHYRPDDDGQHAPRSHFVIRYRPAGGNSPELQDVQENELRDEDRAAGVVGDRVGRFVSS